MPAVMFEEHSWQPFSRLAAGAIYTGTYTSWPDLVLADQLPYTSALSPKLRATLTPNPHPFPVVLFKTVRGACPVFEVLCADTG